MIDQIVVLDTETTGLDPTAGAALLEVAWVALRRGSAGSWYYGEPGTYASTFITHTGDIPPEARAVHHIAPADVNARGPGVLSREVLLHDMLAAEVPGEMMYAAHNAAFDRQFLPELGQSAVAGDTPLCPWICTWRCAQHLWPHAPGHSNQVLRYWLGVEPPEAMLYEPGRVRVLQLQDNADVFKEYDGLVPLAPHRALYDTACTAAILQRMLETHTPETLLALTTAPVRLHTVRFGKHRGALWSEVPVDYLRWMTRQDFDADVVHTVKCELEERG